MTNSAETPSSSAKVEVSQPVDSSKKSEKSSPAPESLSSGGDQISPPIKSSPPPEGSSSSSPPPPSPISNPTPPSPPPPVSNSPPPSPHSDSPPPSPPPPSPGSGAPNVTAPPPSKSNASPPPPPLNSPPPPPDAPSKRAPPPSDKPSSPPSSPPSPPPPKNDGAAAPPGKQPSPPPPYASPPTDNSSPPPKSHSSSPSDKQLTPPPHGPKTSSKSVSPPPPKRASSSKNDGSSSPSATSTTNTTTIVGVAVAGAFIIALLMVVFVTTRRRKKKAEQYISHYLPPHKNISPQSDGGYFYGNPPSVGHNMNGAEGYYHSFGSSYGSQRGNMYHGGGGPDSGVIGGSKSFFTYEEVMEITNGFSRQNVIGEGGFGCVFKGWLPDGKEVAVKQLKAGSGQGEREFRAEVEIISRVHHRYLVSLVGYCISDNQRLLIYEFVPNKTLEHHLHGTGLPVLDWTKRLRIALGSAKGLAYLHEDCHPKIIHRDIKSANILLDDSFEAQVADFGLAKLTNDMHTHVSTRVMGTFGYMAPEYASSGKLTDRSDVFSFGVVLLELVTGRKPVDPTQPLGDESLVEWARPHLIHALETGDFADLVDPRLEFHYVESEMFRMIEAAAACVRHSAPKRPRMVQVVRALDSESEMSDLSNGVKYGQSTVYDSGQYNQEIMKFRRMALGSDSSDFDPNSGEYRNSRESGPISPWKSSDLSSSESETRAINASRSDSRRESRGYSGPQRNYSGRKF